MKTFRRHMEDWINNKTINGHRIMKGQNIKTFENNWVLEIHNFGLYITNGKNEDYPMISRKSERKDYGRSIVNYDTPELVPSVVKKYIEDNEEVLNDICDNVRNRNVGQEEDEAKEARYYQIEKDISKLKNIKTIKELF